MPSGSVLRCRLVLLHTFVGNIRVSGRSMGWTASKGCSSRRKSRRAQAEEAVKEAAARGEEAMGAVARVAAMAVADLVAADLEVVPQEVVCTTDCKPGRLQSSLHFPESCPHAPLSSNPLSEEWQEAVSHTEVVELEEQEVLTETREAGARGWEVGMVAEEEQTEAAGEVDVEEDTTATMALLEERVGEVGEAEVKAETEVVSVERGSKAAQEGW
eukprot:1770296-Prymnesium_polylepis.1